LLQPEAVTAIKPSEKIIQQIDEHLGELNSTIVDFTRPHHALHPQLLIQELAAREQRSQTKIMVICTVVITVLTIIIAALTAVMTWATFYRPS
jgi:hypothetical protein